MATANGYNDDDRKRIVSAMQSMRDRLGGFLAKTYGDNFDGDIDTILEAVNFMKAVRIEKPAAVPVADALRDSLGAMEAHARMYPHMDKGFMVDARNKAKRALSTQAPPAAVLADQEPLCLEVGNYYGMLQIRCKAGAPEWCVENYSGCHWNPCPRPVYNALLAAALAETEDN